MIPILFITYNRLGYTKKTLLHLLESQNCSVTIIDNASTDGTVEWLKELSKKKTYRMIRAKNLIFNDCNLGVAGAMNQFFDRTKTSGWIGKVDNDTIVERDWAIKLIRKAQAVGADIIQAKHHIIPTVHSGGWSGLMKTLKGIDEETFETPFVGGSGIIFRRTIIKEPLASPEWKLGGWNDWQVAHPEFKKVFYGGVEVRLLDEHGYFDYPEYYRETLRQK
jgi:GT2 family glycosyltransferase